MIGYRRLLTSAKYSVSQLRWTRLIYLPYRNIKDLKPAS